MSFAPITTAPAGSTAKCPGQESLSKKERVQLRKNIISEGKQSEDPGVRDAAERLERDNRAVERARLSDHVYSSKKIPVPPSPEGWDQLSGDELYKRGLFEDDLNDPISGFKATIYRLNFEDKPTFVVAFAGTEDMLDFKEAVFQEIGMETIQYNKAMDLSKFLARQLGPQNVEFTGHSLGGGLAAAGNAVTGSNTTTFNTEGLSPRTAARYDINPDVAAERGKNVIAYHATNDILTFVQDTIPGLNKAIGTRYEVLPAPGHELTWRDKLFNPIKSILTGHSSTNIVGDIEYRKINDVNTILKG